MKRQYCWRDGQRELLASALNVILEHPRVADLQGESVSAFDAPPTSKMKRSKQVFEAPRGSEGEDALPIDPSPWHAGRAAALFLEQWERILIFARTVDPVKADIIAAYACSSDPRDVVHVAIAELVSSLEFMSLVRVSLTSAAPLEPEPTEELPENFTNDEIARMVDAIRAVLGEAVRLRAPFRAWVE
jgi:hypothetical protein